MARVYDYWIGGKDNFAADREMAAAVEAIYPPSRQMAIRNRQFLSRAVPWCAAQGITQFLDLGSGIPGVEPVHEAVPGCRVAYVDRETEAVAHGRVLIAGDPGTAMIQADLRDAGAVLCDPAVLKVIDLSQPVGLIFGMVLHFVSATEARAAVAAYVSAAAPGSYAVISCGRNDDEAMFGRAREKFQPAGDLRNHTRDDIRSFFGALEMMPPGLVVSRAWRGGMPDPGLRPDGPAYVLAGVGRKS